MGGKLEGTKKGSQVENWASWKGTEKSLWRRDYPDISAAESAIRNFFFPFIKRIKKCFITHEWANLFYKRSDSR